MEKNLTTGSVFGNIVRFSLPYLFSYSGLHSFPQCG